MTTWFRIGRAAAYLLAVVLFAAVLGKYVAPAGFRAFIVTREWIPEVLHPIAFITIPTVELLVALLLVLFPGPIILGVCGLRLTGFSGAILRDALLAPTTLRCNCFGGETTFIDDRSTMAVALARNSSLIAVAVTGIIGASGNRIYRRSIEPRRRSLSPSFQDASLRRAFTLIELLVVMGILAILLSLLVPAAARIRAQAKSAACLSNLREIGQLAQAWAANHEGYVPLAGSIVVAGPDGGPDHLGAALHDSARNRYAYSGDKNLLLNGREWTVPFDVALIAWTSGNDPTAWQNLRDWDREVLTSVPVGRVFQCPSDLRAQLLHPANEFRAAYSGILYSGTYGQFMPWWTTHDYALNGGLLSFDSNPAGVPRRMRGRLAAAGEPSAVVLAGDTPSLGRIWLPTLTGDRPATLSDVLEKDSSQIEGVDLPPLYHAQFRDLPGVHRTRINVLFVDGHAESVDVSRNALQRCRLTN